MWHFVLYKLFPIVILALCIKDTDYILLLPPNVELRTGMILFAFEHLGYGRMRGRGWSRKVEREVRRGGGGGGEVMGNDIVRTYVGVCVVVPVGISTGGRVSSNLSKRSTATGGENDGRGGLGARCVGYVYIILKYYSLEHLFCYVYIYIYTPVHTITRIESDRG